MNKKINRNLSLGETVIIYPGIIDNFNKLQLDYCCGGAKNLEVALLEKGIDANKFIEEANSDYEKFIIDNSEYIDWNEKTSAELIEHIINTHHNKTFQLLKEIDPLLVKVFKVHYDHNPELLIRVHKLFEELKCELVEHLIKEEKILFPKMMEFENIKDSKAKEALRKEIQDFIGEHEAAGDILKELAEITDDYKLPEWACTSFKLVYMKMHELEKDLFIHIHKENNILFKRF